MEDVNRPQLKETAFWKRTLHMLLFAIAYSIAELIIGLLVIAQFVTILFTGRANQPLLRFGNSLAAYVRQILRFVMYNTEQMPFPFSDWPEEPADGERWLGDRTRAAGAAAGAVGAEAPGARDAPDDGQRSTFQER